MSQTSVVLCEGYHDRAFWYGWLESLGCRFGKETPLPPGYQKGSGEYDARTLSGNFVGVIPAGGQAVMSTAVETRLSRRLLVPIAHLVLSIDADTEADETAKTGTEITSILSMAQGVDSAATINAEGDVELDGGKTRISLVRWEVVGDMPAGVPTKQTWERLVCAAMVAAYPERGVEVTAWLKERDGPKELAWSYMAGWYAESGCDDFYRAVWRDAKIALLLEKPLRESGAWRIAEALAK